ncbi:carboxymuconolactone decarboxylase family protein [Jiangella mangrovi]|nr:carboxymuconolactone decarboxylase family protein [Jiangella mangrovi]
MPPLTARDELTAEQRTLWDVVAGGPRAATAIRESGQLTGPFDVLLRSPEVGVAVAELGARLRYGSSLDRRETELVIVTAAAHWRGRYAWLRHAVYARDAGLADEVLTALAAGAEPDLATPADRAVHAVVDQLLRTGQVGDDAYAAAVELLGERKLVDVVALTGYYSLSSFLLNAFDVPLPTGAGTPWDAEPPTSERTP